MLVIRCFFLQQKTAYEMLISYWSSDVCSSDLLSYGFCVDRHRNDFRTLIESGAIDILFANEDEACSLTKTDSFDSAARSEERRVGTEWGSTCSLRGKTSNK